MWGLKFERTLCLSPHPDDVELSMFGTIVKFSSTQFDVLCLSIGGRYDPSSSLKRHEEIRSFWKSSGCENVNLFFLSDFLTSESEGWWVSQIEKKFPLWVYDSLCVPPAADTHFEHRLVNQVGQALVRNAPLGLLEYRTVSTTGSWCPNLYVNIEREYEQKLQHLQRISTQREKVYFGEKVLNALHSDVASLRRGVEKVEMYRVLQLTCDAVVD